LWRISLVTPCFVLPLLGTGCHLGQEADRLVWSNAPGVEVPGAAPDVADLDILDIELRRVFSRLRVDVMVRNPGPKPLTVSQSSLEAVPHAIAFRNHGKWVAIFENDPTLYSPGPPEADRLRIAGHEALKLSAWLDSDLEPEGLRSLREGDLLPISLHCQIQDASRQTTVARAHAERSITLQR
jgi:hypothetical protein